MDRQDRGVGSVGVLGPSVPDRRGCVGGVPDGRLQAAITSAINKPIVAFVFNQAGLMGSLSLEGSNIARIER
jgi:lipid-binding SYLF domain-containing protein